MLATDWNKGLDVGLEAPKEAVFVYVFEAAFGLRTPRRREKRVNESAIQGKERKKAAKENRVLF